MAIKLKNIVLGDAPIGIATQDVPGDALLRVPDGIDLTIENRSVFPGAPTATQVIEVVLNHIGSRSGEIEMGPELGETPENIAKDQSDSNPPTKSGSM